MSDSNKYDNLDVAIIGAGPAGIAAAMTLKKMGIDRVMIFERAPEAGGAPRHCGHPPFGMFEYARVMTGPSYAKRLVESARKTGIDILTKASVTALGAEGALTVTTPDGTNTFRAKRVLLATGIRETPPSARLTSGDRMLGICTTGTLQSMIYLKKMIPFRNPVVVGTEKVSISALWTCKKAGINPVAMLEENSRAALCWPLYHAARVFGVIPHLNTQITDIRGGDRVKSVRVMDGKGNAREINCDGVLFTGQFTPEAALVRMSHLEVDPDTGSPAIGPSGRCSDKAYYAAGNLLPPLNMAFNCWREGCRAARNIAKDLSCLTAATE